MNGQIDSEKQIDIYTYSYMDRWMEDRQIYGLIDRYTDIQKEIDRYMDRQIYRQLDIQIDIDRQMYRQIDGQVDKQMYGQIE